MEPRIPELSRECIQVNLSITPSFCACHVFGNVPVRVRWVPMDANCNIDYNMCKQ